MSRRYRGTLRPASVRIVTLAASALALAAVGPRRAAAQAPSPPPSSPAGAWTGDTDSAGHWLGAGLQVDWLGNPLEIPRIEISLDGRGKGTIDYPSLGCSGRLRRIGAAGPMIEYRETLTSGADRCPSGAFVGLRPAGDRWIYSWAVRTDWLRPEAMASLQVPPQAGAGPDGDWVRSGVLSAVPRRQEGFAPLDPAASVAARIANIENNMVPPVVVKGEAIPPASLAARMAALHVPGLSVAVIHNGRIDWTRAYGAAGPGGAPATTETLFQAASISKPVTALVTLRLAQNNTVDLDVDVNTYLKTWKVPEDGAARGRPITLRELLSHTAGVTVHGFAGYAPDRPVPGIDQILKGEKPANSAQVDIDTAPGTLWRYSGGGYVIIRKVLEDATGLPFAELARRTVLAPCGMTHSSFDQPLDAARMKDAAWPYGADGQPLKEGPHTYPEVTPDGLWTTPTDLARLALQVQAALRGDANPLLDRARVREMLDVGGLANWGLGWGLGGGVETPYFWHSGSNAGYKSMLFIYGAGEGAIVMTNADSGEKLASDLVRTIAYEYGWPDFRPVEISPVAVTAPQMYRLAGRYRIGRYALLAISRADGQLFAQTPDRARFRLYPRSASQWFAVDPDGFTPNPNVQIAFDAGVGGQAGAVVMRKDGVSVTAPRLDEAAARAVTEALQARVAAKAPAPGSEAALRGYIERLATGQPDYDTLGPAAAYITRLLLLNFASDISGLGAVQHIEFKGVGAEGADQFVVQFANGVAQAQILQGEDGRIEQVYLASPAFM